ncbi:MAG: hypothetical protein FWD90_07500 [Defluviitaleaceae bacterium]|nr:hypothetical protein [Defluviitaleaceae bacterium]
MIKNNLLFLEDDGGALSVMNLLEEFYGYNIYHTAYDWKSVEYWLFDNPGIDSFVAILFDMRLPIYNLPNYGVPYNESVHYSPSLYFIENFIMRYFPSEIEKILLVSAYFDNMPFEKIKRFNIFEKSDGEVINKLISKINELSNN